ncbi:mRNA-decapping enzyme-like protein [Populus alba x Populus x berolinensis]|uniref:mRNA-decapping enzyme-like protein n=1 Tax=Populus alba x Populus x berolinensis TaxID=444605 RepID=A0AAD6MJ15_9ROSI|nr:mRNA-decapping enzyme-like protein [Populus alba x Populus x berolinensis]
MPQNGKLMPNIDQQSTKLLNLTVLQRIDPLVEEILITAAHVTLYQFNIDLTQWSRKDVEGSLFVVKRNMQPRFQFIVMNRRNTDNLVENLLGDFEYEVQVPYLLYRNAAQEVNGIWFYNARECEEVANLFSRILNAYSKVPQKPKVSLSSTKSEFEELEAVPTMAVMDGPLEPSSANASVVSDVPDDPAFVNFFSTAMTIGTASTAAVAGQSYQSSIPIPLHSQLTSVASSTMPTLQIPSPPLSASIPLMPLLDVSEISSSSNRTANLVKPSFFVPPSSSTQIMPPVSSSIPTAPPLNPPTSLHRPYGAPLLQPFPPPTPPPSLTPASVPSPNHGPFISKDKVRDALLALVQYQIDKSKLLSSKVINASRGFLGDGIDQCCPLLFPNEIKMATLTGITRSSLKIFSQPLLHPQPLLFFSKGFSAKVFVKDKKILELYIRGS